MDWHFAVPYHFIHGINQTVYSTALFRSLSFQPAFVKNRKCETH